MGRWGMCDRLAAVDAPVTWALRFRNRGRAPGMMAKESRTPSQREDRRGSGDGARMQPAIRK
jgi:hypothetical protein